MDGLSQELREAKNSKVVLHPGLLVKVRTKKGALVGQGLITNVDPEIGFVTVADTSAGADLRVDVDAERYNIWVDPPSDYAPRMPPEVTLYMRGSRPGAHANAKIKM